MNEEILTESSCTATINAPIEFVDIQHGFSPCRMLNINAALRPTSPLLRLEQTMAEGCRSMSRRLAAN